MNYFTSHFNKGISCNYDNHRAEFEFFYTHLLLFQLSNVLVNKAWADSSGILDLDQDNRLKIRVDDL
jgi:hypothetical protein